MTLHHAGFDIQVLGALPVSVPQICNLKKLTYKNFESISVFPNNPYSEYLNMAFRFLLGLLKFWKYKRQYGLPNIIHLHTYSQGYLVRWLHLRYQIPFIITEHYSKLLSQERMKSWEISFCRQLFQLSSLNIAVSESQKRILEKLYGAPFSVMPNFVDLNKFAMGHEAQKKNKNDCIQLLSVGNITSNKGFQIIIDALSQLNSDGVRYKLDIIGVGKYKADLLKLESYQKHKENINFLGLIPNSELPKYYQRSNIYISASEVETFGITVIEALACGTPVVVTAEGSKMLVTHNIHGIHADRSADSLAEAIEACSQLRTPKKELRQHIASSYSFEVMLKAYAKIYERYTGIGLD